MVELRQDGMHVRSEFSVSKRLIDWPKLQNDEGTAPVKLLLLKKKLANFVSWPSWDGMEPSIRFEFR